MPKANAVSPTFAAPQPAPPLSWPGTVPAHVDPLAAAVAAIERPERAASLSDCLDSESIGERQQAAAAYRLEVLRVCGLAAPAACEV